MASPVWFITGSSNGLGLLLSLRALRAGHRVIATVRDAERSAEAVQSIKDAGGRVVEMDSMESRQSIINKVQEAEKIHGRIDFLVNNAGYSQLGPVEFFTEEETERQFRTNVFGPLFVMQAALPGMRSRKAGTIINVSSVAGHDATPSCGLYAASKFGLEGLSESLSKEVASFGISVLLVEPGAFRTNFLHAIGTAEPPVVQSGYEGTPVDAFMTRFHGANGKQAGDPHKAVEAVFEVATGEGKAGKLKGKVLRLVLGDDAFTRIEGKIRSVQGDMETTREVGLFTAFDS
ncbi:related to dehydrogenases with different specificities (related to short-chain alcohol dehydrogenases) [Cephalotrichum gorgonifer]|uniref:Related to dehydrogenases with different specificities (Related to short-chain alcohol dehydrogenases) n=1 Tax=Cephalotrichum gorgonifer TaxID=2041049 RepID=A0AAE8N2U6_9PEZI|nr:related to dehydrogenases with different specificities (related to short-chain alcohol dehydrogenases) [Cephalotrichum gorgonifer]